MCPHLTTGSRLYTPPSSPLRLYSRLATSCYTRWRVSTLLAATTALALLASRNPTALHHSLQ
jgi:hypothetical protein